MSQIEAEASPLTQQERDQVARLLSDPFSFPLAYKTWLVSYMETSDLSLPMASILGLRKALGLGAPAPLIAGAFTAPRRRVAGLVFTTAWAVLPPDVLLCDGAEYQKDDYPELYANVAGSVTEPTPTSFNVPTIPDLAPGVRYVIAR